MKIEFSKWKTRSVILLGIQFEVTTDNERIVNEPRLILLLVLYLFKYNFAWELHIE